MLVAVMSVIFASAISVLPIGTHSPVFTSSYCLSTFIAYSGDFWSPSNSEIDRKVTSPGRTFLHPGLVPCKEKVYSVSFEVSCANKDPVSPWITPGQNICPDFNRS